MHKIALTIFILASLAISGCAASESEYILVNISDNCTGKQYDKIGNVEAKSGKQFLVIGVEIENHGYNSFYVDPSVFAIVIDKVEYRCSFVTYSLDEVLKLPSLESVTLQNGGRKNGYIAYEIPVVNEGFTFKYIGWESRNVTFKCTP